ncbi:MAG TPA: hypothetical protein VKB54_19740 [Solirubrobacteraceae bacterium]|nr:hypothetical protein [Solirubrobacteraceae bacterium]
MPENDFHAHRIAAVLRREVALSRAGGKPTRRFDEGIGVLADVVDDVAKRPAPADALPTAEPGPE